MEPLCPTLYRRLTELFGHVMVANAGQAVAEGIYTDSKTGRRQKRVLHGGEEYRACCPHCRDTRYRLYICHRFADFPWLAFCHNEDCFRSAERKHQLYLMLFRTSRPVRLPIQQARVNVPSTVQLPPNLIPLANLATDHPANYYLAERGFDVRALSTRYDLAYCAAAEGQFWRAARRIIIPIRLRGHLQGWQGRFVGERNWAFCETPKYVGTPGKANLLYNFDLARSQPFLVVVEGVMDVWAFGSEAVALLGKSMSTIQREMIATEFGGRPIGVMLDGEAEHENRRIHDMLARNVNSRVFQVTLPAGCDPGNLSRAENLEFVFAAAKAQGIELARSQPELCGGEPPNTFPM